MLHFFYIRYISLSLLPSILSFFFFLNFHARNQTKKTNYHCVFPWHVFSWIILFDRECSPCNQMGPNWLLNKFTNLFRLLSEYLVVNLWWGKYAQKCYNSEINMVVAMSYWACLTVRHPIYLFIYGYTNIDDCVKLMWSFVPWS